MLCLIFGFIGGTHSDVSIGLASILTRTGHVQVSYSSTSPVLSNKDDYPYFLRIVTPDNVQAEAMMEIVKALQGEYIQIVYNEGAYGIGGRDSVIASAKARGICIAQITKVRESSRYYEYYERLRKKPHAKIVIVFLNSNIVRNFMRDMNDNEKNTAGEFQFIGSASWGQNSDNLLYDVTNGALTLSMDMEPIIGLMTYIQNQLHNINQSEPLLEQYIQHRQNCYYNWSYDKSFSKVCTSKDIIPAAEKSYFQTDHWCVFATTAMLSLLMGSAEMFSKVCGNTEKLCQAFVENPYDLVEEMKNISMDINGTGETKVSHYLFENILCV